MIEAPTHLRPPTRDRFNAVVSDFDLEEHHLRLLTLAGEAWDRGQQAREVLDHEGLTYTDASGRHASGMRSRSSATPASHLRDWCEMSLDAEPPSEPSRPPAIR